MSLRDIFNRNKAKQLDAEPEEGRVSRWAQRLAPWGDNAADFKVQGFYERFPAKGEVERVARIHRELARTAKIEIKTVEK